MKGNHQIRQSQIESATQDKAFEPALKAADPQETSERNDVIANVIGCTKLNVRERPNVHASVLTAIPVNSEVMVDLNNSTVDFYKVYTAAGIEGFCMKQYIVIRH